MDLTHHFHVPTSLDDTWTHFQDVPGLAGCFPGAQITSVEGDAFTGSCKVKLGPIALVYNGTGTFLERDEAGRRLVVEAKGKDKRGNGTATAKATLSMIEAAEGGTDVEVGTDLAITGKPAQFGRGLIQDVSDKLLGQFVTCLAQQLSQDDTDATGSPPPAADAPSSADAPADATTTPSNASVPDTPTTTPDPAARPRPPSPAPTQQDALDLGATLLPVLVKSYWKQALAGAAALTLAVLLLRRRSGS